MSTTLRHLKAWHNAILKMVAYEEQEESKERDADLLKQLVFNSIKVVTSLTEPTNRKEEEERFLLHSSIVAFVEKLTPREFMNIFPIKKFYKGQKFGMKDYYSTLEHIETLELDEPLDENAKMLMMKYVNDDIDDYMVEQMMCLSRLRQYEGHLNLIEEFMATNGMETPNTFKNVKGDVMYVRNGRPEKLQVERRLKVV